MDEEKKKKNSERWFGLFRDEHWGPLFENERKGPLFQGEQKGALFEGEGKSDLTGIFKRAVVGTVKAFVYPVRAVTRLLRL